MKKSNIHIYLFLCAISYLIANFVDRLPIGYFWWDWIALIGASDAIEQGLVPVRDFWSAYIFPLYEVFFAVKIFGMARAYLGLHMLQFFIAGLFSIILVDIKSFSKNSLLFFCAIWILSFFPLNMRNTGYGVSFYDIEYSGYLNFNSFYNRFNGVLLIIVYIGGICFIKKSNSYKVDKKDLISSNIKCFVLSIIGVFLFYSKITSYIIFLFILISNNFLFKSNKYNVKNIFTGILVLIITLMFFEFEYGITTKYLQETIKIVSYKSINFVDADFNARWAVIKYFYPYELLLLELCMFFLILSSIFLPYYSSASFIVAELDSFYNLRLVLYLSIFVCSCLVISMTNNGDSLLFPIILSIYFTLINLRHNNVYDFHAYYIIRIFYKYLEILFMSWVIFYIILYFYWMASFALTLLPQSYVELNSGVPRLDESFIIENKSNLNASKLTKYEIINNINQNYSDPPHFVNLSRSYAILNDMLRKNISNSKARVIALTFPAYLPSVLAGFHIPKGTFAWFLLNYEVSLNEDINVFAITKDVDNLVVSKCELNELNQIYLSKIFKPVIEHQFQLIDKSDCWEIYNRKS